MEQRTGNNNIPLLDLEGGPVPPVAMTRQRSGSFTRATGVFAEEQQDAEIQARTRPFCWKVLIAFLIWAPWTVFVAVLFYFLFFVQQLLVLILRPCGGRPLVVALRLWQPVMSFVTTLIVTTGTCETCYGAELKQVETFDEFVQSFSAARRKNIRRNLKAADEAIAAKGIEVTFHPAGTWRISAELRGVIWDSCQRHKFRAWGYSDILNCGKPLPPIVTYVGEIVLMLSFPCDLQAFRTRDGQLVSINTHVKIGQTYWNPNYATLEEYAKCGIYPWSIRYQLMESIRNRAHTYNSMPSMREAKAAMGLKGLVRSKLWYNSLACPSREPPREPEGLPTAVIEADPPRTPKKNKAKGRPNDDPSPAASSAPKGPKPQKVRSEADIEKERIGREQAAALRAERDRRKAERADMESVGADSFRSSSMAMAPAAAPAQAEVAVPKSKPKGKATGQAPTGGKKAAMKKAAKEKKEKEAAEAAAAAAGAGNASASDSAIAGSMGGSCFIEEVNQNQSYPDVAADKMENVESVHVGKVFVSCNETTSLA